MSTITTEDRIAEIIDEAIAEMIDEFRAEDVRQSMSYEEAWEEVR